MMGLEWNIFVGIGLILAAAMLGYLSYSNRLGEGWLDKANKIASLLAVLLGIASLFVPAITEDVSPGSQRAIVTSSENVNIGQAGDDSQIIFGDLSTTAEKRHANAAESVREEIGQNFGALSLQIDWVQAQTPQAFWDTRRPNETETAYQDRALNEFRDYRNFVEEGLRPEFSDALLQMFRKELAFDPELASQIIQIYRLQDETQQSLKSYHGGLRHLGSLQLNDQERTARALSLYREKVAEAKMNLMDAVSAYCLIAAPKAMAALNVHLSALGIDEALVAGPDGFATAKQLAAGFAEEKQRVLQEQIAEGSRPPERTLSRQIDDPYLRFLRETMGLPPALTEAELASLSRKRLDRNETNPVKLFQLAALSYVEADGRAAEFYFERAIETGTLPDRMRRFAETSLDRLQNPAKYDGSLGVMVLTLSGDEAFARAGLEVGDVIVAAGRTKVHEPLDIASALGKASDPTLALTVVRGEEKHILSVRTGQPAGAALSQLVILNRIQL